MYKNNEDVLEAARDAVALSMPELAGELSAMLRDLKYKQTRLLKQGDFVIAEPTRFGCPFGRVIGTSRQGNQYGPDWIKIVWYKWNFVPCVEWNDSNIIHEVVHQRKDKPAYELGVRAVTPEYIILKFHDLLPWKEQMAKEKFSATYACPVCGKPLEAVWGGTLCSQQCADTYWSTRT